MKSGTGDDPFADPFEEDDDSAESEQVEDAEDVGDADTEPASEPDETNSSSEANPAKPDDSHIPWVLRRSSVKDDRPNVTQFFLRDETDRAERRLRSDVEEILDKDVYTLDLREAAYLVAMEHPDEVASMLRDWGYDYLD